MTRDKFKTLNDVFDLFTENNLAKLADKGYFERLVSPVALGKEANVFTAQRSDGSFVIVKIYRLSTCDFQKMHQYMLEDPRFVDVRKNRREVIFSWAKREYSNLFKARAAGVSVPSVFGVFYNMVIMECIGGITPAPKLKDKTPVNKARFFNLIVDEYRKLYKAGFVHGDLSGFNILNDNERPVFIDMSQSTTIENPHAESYLKRDIKNVLAHFKKLGVMRDEADVLREITR